MKDEITANRLLTRGEKDRLADAKKVSRVDYDTYLTDVETDVQAIIDSGVFPERLEPSDIHDHFEKNREAQ